MAKTVPSKGRPPVAAPSIGEGGGFLGGVWGELRKTAWPTWDELTRMTAVVIMTVIIFSLLIGAADYLLGNLLGHFVYKSQ